MKMSVIILNWNDAAATAQCVAAVQAWRQIQPEVIIVDNGSQPEDVGKLEQLAPTARLLRNKHNSGFAGGNNLGLEFVLQNSDAPVLLLNNDAHIAEEHMTKLLKLLTAHPDAAIIGPILIEKSGEETILSAGGKNIARYTNAHVNLPSLPTEPTSLQVVDYVPGTIALLSNKVLHEVGLLDTEYFFSGEIADWCERARRKGFRALIAPQAQGYHYLKKASNVRSTLYSYYSLRNRFLFIAKFEQRKWAWFWVYYSLRMTAANLRRGKLAAARATLLAVWHGLTGRFGNQNHFFGYS